MSITAATIYTDGIRADIEMITEAKGYGGNLNEETIETIRSFIILTKLAIQYILYLAHYQNHQQYDEIYNDFKTEVDNCLKNFYKQEDLQKAKDYFFNLVADYSTAFEDENCIKSLTNIFRSHLETIIFKMLIPEPIPSVHAFMPCYIFISNYLLGFQAFLNRWYIS